MTRQLISFHWLIRWITGFNDAGKKKKKKAQRWRMRVWFASLILIRVGRRASEQTGPRTGDVPDECCFCVLDENVDSCLSPTWNRSAVNVTALREQTQYFHVKQPHGSAWFCVVLCGREPTLVSHGAATARRSAESDTIVFLFLPSGERKQTVLLFLGSHSVLTRQASQCFPSLPVLVSSRPLPPARHYLRSERRSCCRERLWN